MLQKTRSEALGRNDCDTDDIVHRICKIARANNEHPYIRKFSTPFTIYLGLSQHIEFLKYHHDSILYFDATGSVIRKPYDQSKRVYLYARVVNFNKNSSCA